MSDEAEKAAEAWLSANDFKIEEWEVDGARHAFLAGYAAAMQWSPIESAPRDGSVIAVNDTNPYADTPFVAAKYITGEEWSGWIYDDGILQDSTPEGPKPTKWFPVPPSE